MNQFDERHYRFQRYPDRKLVEYPPYSEPKWMPWVGGFIAGCLFGLMLFLGV